MRRGLDTERAQALFADAEVIDLHVDSFIWSRVFGYDLRTEHDLGPLQGRWFSQLDLPRARAADLGGCTWSITTNPLRGVEARRRVFFENLDRLSREFPPEDFALIGSASDYWAARAAGRQAVLFGIQGGEALEHDLDDLLRLPPSLLRITVIGFRDNAFGGSSTGKVGGGLSALGEDYIERMDAQRIFVDLAHASREAFWRALEVAEGPVIVSHAGVEAVTEHARNLSDAQLRAIADTGGLLGVIFKDELMGGRGVSSEAVAAHIAHATRVMGEDHVALGADWDGFMVPPIDLRTPAELPKLIASLFAAGLEEAVVRKVLGLNVLRALEQLRPAATRLATSVST